MNTRTFINSRQNMYIERAVTKGRKTHVPHRVARWSSFTLA